jgi:glutamine---fructose-6-phosphate transaminase (isomerizing)
VLAFAPRGPAQASTLQTAVSLRERGATVLVAASDGLGDVPIAPSAHPWLDALTTMQSFYMMVEALARARGMNPDAPAHLSKVTRTH